MKPSSRLVAAFAALLVIVSLGAAVRFHRLGQRGLDGSDTVLYTTIGKAWSEGQYLDRIGGHRVVYRPVIFYLDGLAIDWLGYDDAAIKSLNAAMDSLSIALIFAACMLLCRGAVAPACAAALVYAASPIAIQAARSELAHTVSTTMLMVSIVLFLCAEAVHGVWKRRLLILASGAFCGLAVWCHEELALASGGFCLVLGLRWWAAPRGRQRTEHQVLEQLLFLGPVIAAASEYLPIHAQVLLGDEDPGRPGVRAEASAHLLEPVVRSARFLWDALLAYGSTASLVLFVAGVVLLAWVSLRAIAGRDDAPWRRELWLPPFVLLSYIAAFGLLFERLMMRLFLPLFPLVLLTLFSLLHHAMSTTRLPAPWQRMSPVLVGLLLALGNLSNYARFPRYYANDFSDQWASPIEAMAWAPQQGLDQLGRLSYTTTRSRRVFDLLAGKVGDQARLLVIGSRFFPLPGRRPLQVGYYFGDDAIDLIDHDEPIDRLIERLRVRYVLLTSSLAGNRWVHRKTYSRYLYGGRWLPQQRLVLGASLGFGPGEYSVEKEWQVVTGFLAERGARLLLAQDWAGVPYEQPLAWKQGYLLWELPESRSSMAPDGAVLLGGLGGDPEPGASERRAAAGRPDTEPGAAASPAPG